MRTCEWTMWDAGISNLVGYCVYTRTYTHTHLHTFIHYGTRTMGFRGRGRKLVGCRPRLECDEGKNEWFQRNLKQSSQGSVIPATHRRRDSSTIQPMIREEYPFPQPPLLRLIGCNTHIHWFARAVYGSPDSRPRQFRKSPRKTTLIWFALSQRPWAFRSPEVM